jgi:hypothetical protein
MYNRKFRAYLWLRGAYANIGKTVRLCLQGASGAPNLLTLDYVLTGDWARVDTGLWTGGADTCGVKFTLQCLPTPSDSPIALMLTGAQLIEDGTDTAYVPTTSFAQPPGFNGRRTVLFNGVSHYLKTAGFTLNQPETLYLVVRQKSWTASHYLTDGNASLTGVIYQYSTSPRLGLYAGSAAAGNDSLAIGAMGIVTAVFNGANSLLQVNAGAPATGNPGAGNMGALTLGALASSSNPANIQVGELLVYAAAHDTNAIGRVLQCLADKWGITL